MQSVNQRPAIIASLLLTAVDWRRYDFGMSEFVDSSAFEMTLLLRQENRLSLSISRKKSHATSATSPIIKAFSAKCEASVRK